jgi:hypothetical protein
MELTDIEDENDDLAEILRRSNDREFPVSRVPDDNIELGSTLRSLNYPSQMHNRTGWCISLMYKSYLTVALS